MTPTPETAVSLAVALHRVRDNAALEHTFFTRLADLLTSANAAGTAEAVELHAFARHLLPQVRDSVVALSRVGEQLQRLATAIADGPTPPQERKP
jgi:hypothetical protein